tara:strand:+ start:56 stop:451 length:396 start_codon:yes stop_codon:yes gene_type:complete
MQAFDDIHKNVGSAKYEELFTGSQHLEARRRAQEFRNWANIGQTGLGAIGEEALAAGQAALRMAGTGSQKSNDPFNMFMGAADFGLNAARIFKNRGDGGGFSADEFGNQASGEAGNDFWSGPGGGIFVNPT